LEELEKKRGKDTYVPLAPENLNSQFLKKDGQEGIETGKKKKKPESEKRGRNGLGKRTNLKGERDTDGKLRASRGLVCPEESRGPWRVFQKKKKRAKEKIKSKKTQTRRGWAIE